MVRTTSAKRYKGGFESPSCLFLFCALHFLDLEYNRTMKTICVAIVFLILTSVAYGLDADKPKTEPKAEPKPKVETKEAPREPPIKSVIVIINSGDMSRILVVSSDGRWVHEARAIIIDSTIGSPKPAKIKCTMYKGLFKPTKPEVKTWELKELMTITSSDFQKILDGLQAGNFELPVVTTITDK